MEDGAAEQLEQRSDALDVVRGAADHEDEVGLLGTPLGAADRRVDHADAALRQRRGGGQA